MPKLVGSRIVSLALVELRQESLEAFLSLPLLGLEHLLSFFFRHTNHNFGQVFQAATIESVIFDFFLSVHDIIAIEVNDFRAVSYALELLFSHVEIVVQFRLLLHRKLVHRPMFLRLGRLSALLGFRPQLDLFNLSSKSIFLVQALRLLASPKYAPHREVGQNCSTKDD